MTSKRIILCFDGTFTDTGDTSERLKPGSYVSRICRWILPPILWQLLWVLRFFAVFKWIEQHILLPRPKAPGSTNVSILARSIKTAGTRVSDNGSIESIHQLTLYVGGIGALGNPQSRVEEAVTGNTMTYKVRTGYRFLVENYCPGDEVFLFGFSRGAFAARAIADFISCRGITRKHTMDNFDLSWQRFVEERKMRVNVQCREETGGTHRNPPIRCIGVWDTVGSLGAPPLFFHHRDDISTARSAHRRSGHFDVSLRPNAEYAFQALALDERRFDFYPAPWAFQAENEVRFAQTWFPGVHADIGGGSSGDLSDFAFVWMVSKIQEDNLLDLDEEFLQAAVLQSLKEGISPWYRTIGPRDYLDRLSTWLRNLPAWITDCFRVAHRNPHMLATNIDQTDTKRAEENKEILAKEQKFHWTVGERMRKQQPSYWETCPALKKRYPYVNNDPTEADIFERMEVPVGKDLELFRYFTTRNS
ncbi:hypothetical protein BGZ61DRAFT_537760 [Ilyonectria robusta]|uniref:uncharacterized protein n=1 Tax=Ilyonectria robusta TaxID=1079257 RepID=UPI001E8CA90C|nr:uncharacterized protein BGZ61DRAFT_537760 [Ilyonectria robusta]KAH8669338.1 hypothetical protein BGZ61DRAFT_537760 [Ilyonectria robusta]